MKKNIVHKSLLLVVYEVGIIYGHFCDNVVCPVGCDFAKGLAEECGGQIRVKHYAIELVLSPVAHNIRGNGDDVDVLVIGCVKLCLGRMPFHPQGRAGGGLLLDERHPFSHRVRAHL